MSILDPETGIPVPSPEPVSVAEFLRYVAEYRHVHPETLRDLLERRKESPMRPAGETVRGWLVPFELPEGPGGPETTTVVIRADLVPGEDRPAAWTPSRDPKYADRGNGAVICGAGDTWRVNRYVDDPAAVIEQYRAAHPMLWLRRLGVAVEPVGLAEIAERLGVSRATVDSWRTRGVLPPPDWTVGGRPAWDWATVERFARDTGRLREEGPGER